MCIPWKQFSLFINVLSHLQYTRFSLCLQYLKSGGTNLHFHLLNNSSNCVWHIITTHWHLSLGNDFSSSINCVRFQENWCSILYFHLSYNTSCQYMEVVKVSFTLAQTITFSTHSSLNQSQIVQFDHISIKCIQDISAYLMFQIMYYDVFFEIG